MIIENGRYVYVVSVTLIWKLNMNTIKHERPYRL
jgi:hypothetical protein